MDAKFFLLVICLVLFGIGLLFVLLGIRDTKKTKALRIRCSVETEGFVARNNVKNKLERTAVDHNDKSDYVNVKEYTPVIQYTVDGVDYLHLTSMTESKVKYPVNQKITIWYNPQKPKECYLPMDNVANTSGVFFFVAGVFFVLGGGLLWLWFEIKNW